MSEVFKMIVFWFAGSGVIAWVVMIWAVKLTLQNRLSIKVLSKRKK